MTNKKTDSKYWEDERFIIDSFPQKQKEQIESVRRTLSSFKNSRSVTVKDAIIEMLDYAYSTMLRDTMNYRDL